MSTRFEDAIRRLTVGGAVQLKKMTASDNTPMYARPKKWSIAAKERIDALQRITAGDKWQAAVSAAKEAVPNFEWRMADVMTKLQSVTSGETTEADLSSDEREGLMAAAIAVRRWEAERTIAATAESVKDAAILEGIASISFDDGAEVTVDSEFLATLKTFEDGYEELYQIAEEFNRPLPQATSQTSNKRPSGSTKATSSTRTRKKS